MPTIRHALSGNLPDVKAQVDLSVAGDTVLVPLPGSTTPWPNPLVINGKNIKILGDTTSTAVLDGLANVPIITAAPGIPRLIEYIIEDSSGFTAEIGKFHFKGTVADHKIWLHGRSVLHKQSDGTYIGGIRVHDCGFSVPYYAQGDTVIAGGSTVQGSNTINFNSAHGLTSADAKRALFAINGVPMGACVGTISSSTAITMVNNRGANMVAIGTASGMNITVAGFIGAGAGSNGGTGWIETTEWVEGCIDHCFTDGNPLRYSAVHGVFNMDASPSGTGSWGDYVFQYAPNDGAIAPNMGGTIHGMCLEDNIFHIGSGAFTDTGGGTGGGAVIINRHNTGIAAVACHGTRDSGGAQHGGRLCESYNNLWIVMADSLQSKNDTGPDEGRDGERIMFNNYMQAGAGQSLGHSTLNCYTGVGANGINTPLYARYDYGADGLCVWDLNWKGARQDQAGLFHYPHSPYTHTYAPAAANIKEAVNTTDPTFQQADVVQNGVAADARFSDVYGIVTGGQNSYSNNVTTLIGVIVTYTDPNHTTTVPNNFFRGFVVRNAAVRRSLGNPSTYGDTDICFNYIQSSTSGTATVVSGTTMRVTTTLGLNQSNPGPPSYLPLRYDGASGFMELRRVDKYFGVPGAGHMTKLMVGNTVALLSDGTLPHFVHDLNGESSGFWMWGNKHRAGTGAWTNEGVSVRTQPGGVYELVVPEFHQYIGDAQDVIPGANPRGMQKLFDRNYFWNPSVTANTSDARQRVGANWSTSFTDHGRIVFDTTPGNTFSPEYVSFFLPAKNGAVGIGGNLPYPHPLITPAALVAPVINSQNHVTFTTSVTDSFTVTTNADANPTPTIVLLAGIPFPPGVSIHDEGNGTATITASTGTSPGNTTVNLRASNSVDHFDQAFTVNIVSPTLTLTAPSTGSIYQEPANITITATLTGATGQVDFYNGTGPGGILIGSVSAAPYTFVWSNVPATGSPYTIQARFGITLSTNTVSVTVDPIVVDIPAPPTIVVTA